MDDPVAAESLLDNGKYNKLNAVIQRAAEEVTKISEIKNRVNQYAELTTLLQKEKID